MPSDTALARPSVAAAVEYPPGENLTRRERSCHRLLFFGSSCVSRRRTRSGAAEVVPYQVVAGPPHRHGQGATARRRRPFSASLLSYYPLAASPSRQLPRLSPPAPALGHPDEEHLAAISESAASAASPAPDGEAVFRQLTQLAPDSNRADCGLAGIILTKFVTEIQM